MRTLALTDSNDEIVAKLYVNLNGTLHPDSWIKTGDEKTDGKYKPAITITEKQE